jgi:hypothetical protein
MRRLSLVDDVLHGVRMTPGASSAGASGPRACRPPGSRRRLRASPEDQGRPSVSSSTAPGAHRQAETSVSGSIAAPTRRARTARPRGPAEPHQLHERQPRREALAVVSHGHASASRRHSLNPASRATRSISVRSPVSAVRRARPRASAPAISSARHRSSSGDSTARR